MQNNSILNKAKYSENTDEWYTDYGTVESELSHYIEQFSDKIVLCNCDDPYESAFSRYFLKNFNVLKLKKLICTSYKGSRILEKLQITDNKNQKLNKNSAYVMIVESKHFKSKPHIDDDDIIDFLNGNNVVTKLKGDGDFRSEECIEYLKEADIIVTNPPFSKFIELFSLIIKYNKKFLLIGIYLKKDSISFL